jgi:hypothetical protein
MNPIHRGIGWAACGLLLIGSGSARPDEAENVVLLAQGMGPVASSRAAEQSWGSLEPDRDGQLRWSGFVGFLIRRGYRFGGVLRSRSERVVPGDLDTLGARDDGHGDFYLLASSLPAQEDGLESRARELATAVAAVRRLSGRRPVCLMCYSASGIAARLWMQGAIRTPADQRSRRKCEEPSGGKEPSGCFAGTIPDTSSSNGADRPGAVAHLVTVATPHLGAGGVAGPVTELWDRYRPLSAGSALLRRINRQLDLPAEVDYTSIVIQGTGTSLMDSGRRYARHLRGSAPPLEAIPPLLRGGHDGVVHTLSAQLHLTPAAARYENTTDRPVRVRFCQLGQALGDRPERIAIHNQAIREPELWSVLWEVIVGPRPRGAPKKATGAFCREEWARQIALHLAELHVQRRHLAGRIRASQVVALVPARDGCRWSWQCRCQVDVCLPFVGEETVHDTVTGSFRLGFDRFGRPRQMFDAVVEVDSRSRP